MMSGSLVVRPLLILVVRLPSLAHPNYRVRILFIYANHV